MICSHEAAQLLFPVTPTTVFLVQRSLIQKTIPKIHSFFPEPVLCFLSFQINPKLVVIIVAMTPKLPSSTDYFNLNHKLNRVGFVAKPNRTITTVCSRREMMSLVSGPEFLSFPSGNRCGGVSGSVLTRPGNPGLRP